MSRSSGTLRMVAMLALDTGISPKDLMETPIYVLEAMLEVLEEREKERKAEESRERLAAKLRANGVV